MSDEQEISNLIFHLESVRDRGEWDETGRILEHATFQTHYAAAYPAIGVAPEDVASRPESTTGRLQGGEEIANLHRSTARLYEDGLPHTMHVLSNMNIQVDQDRTSAVVQSYFLVFQSRPDFPLQAISGGRYIDRFSRVDGAWRFSSRDVYAELFGNISHHMAGDPAGFSEGLSSGSGAGE